MEGGAKHVQDVLHAAGRTHTKGAFARVVQGRLIPFSAPGSWESTGVFLTVCHWRFLRQSYTTLASAESDLAFENACITELMLSESDGVNGVA